MGQKTLQCNFESWRINFFAAIFDNAGHGSLCWHTIQARYYITLYLKKIKLKTTVLKKYIYILNLEILKFGVGVTLIQVFLI